ncbi:MAG: hypothetical protein ACLUGP_07580 [Faecalibacterium prausnitzii]
MAYDVSKLAKLAALKALAEKVESDYATKADLKKASDSAAAAFKSGKVDGNTVSLYTSEDESRYCRVHVRLPDRNVPRSGKDRVRRQVQVG